MTLDEVALLLRYEKSTILEQFHRTQRYLKKKGIILTRWGTGKDAEYEVEYEEKEE